VGQIRDRNGCWSSRWRYVGENCVLGRSITIVDNEDFEWVGVGVSVDQLPSVGASGDLLSGHEEASCGLEAGECPHVGKMVSMRNTKRVEVPEVVVSERWELDTQSERLDTVCGFQGWRNEQWSRDGRDAGLVIGNDSSDAAMLSHGMIQAVWMV